MPSVDITFRDGVKRRFENADVDVMNRIIRLSNKRGDVTIGVVPFEAVSIVYFNWEEKI